MTEDQIKAIAEEYANGVIKSLKDNPRYDKFSFQAIFDNCIREAKYVLKIISTRYCIVEREKVIEEFDKTRVLYEGRSDVSIYMQNALYRIFGTSMFKQNEE